MEMLIDAIIGGMGIYIMVQGINMKKTGVIPEGLLVSKKVNLNSIKDKAGFIQYMFLPTMILGVLGLLSGVVGTVNDYMSGLDVITAILSGLFLIALIAFYVMDIKAQKKYIGGKQ
ncbi:MAG: hypothetical protein R3Y24_02635 [Eubacteriales bacterium]